jgi:hypothetical protein
MQKKIFILLLLTLSSSAQMGYEIKDYETGKIDMHGGNENSYSTYKISRFRTAPINISAFLDTNASKKTELHSHKRK